MSSPTREDLLMQQGDAVADIVLRMDGNYAPAMVHAALAQAYTAGYLSGLSAAQAIFAPTELAV